VPRQVAFLRGINLARTNRLAMADLKAALEGLGYRDVRTHGQSGNAVFDGGDPAAKAEQRIHDAVHKASGLDVDVVVRTSAQLAKVVERNPLAKVATDPKKHLVVFLAAKPKASAVKDLDPDAYEPERFAIEGREVYVWLPNGVQRAKLGQSAWEPLLGVRATARNWATVTRVLELASAEPK
jgi:uncharacterized protein (DUF1697 family)